jgi:hypothetical protein
MRNHPFLLRAALAAIAISLLAIFPQAISAAGTSTFYGIVVHVSSNNIKAQNPKTKQTMSFLLVPKFDQVFSADGKTTYQMGKIKAGQYVGIIYDRKALGQAHADKIYLLTNANQTIGTQ